MKNEFNENRRKFDKTNVEEVLNNYDELNDKFEKQGKLKNELIVY